MTRSVTARRGRVALRAALFPLLCCGLLCAPSHSQPTLRLPPRAPDAPTGSEFAHSIRSLSLEERSQRVLDELRAGNVPDSLRRLVPVELRGRTLTLRKRRAVVWVSPDYLAIGSDEDSLRIPVNLYTATAFGREFGFVLPTRKLVDAIHEQSGVRLRPLPMQPGEQMRSIAYYLEHDARIDRQLADAPPGALVSGHKKDVVLTSRLRRKHGRVAIYGWHRRNGEPIQPLSTVHVAAYADYSHGLRLVHERVWVDGEERSIYDVLEDPRLASLLSRSGPIRDARAIMGFPADSEPD